jgi:glyoxylase-like metal-dependent hydrolase (beta-lactamase superfamily II)
MIDPRRRFLEDGPSFVRIVRRPEANAVPRPGVLVLEELSDLGEAEPGVVAQALDEPEALEVVGVIQPIGPLRTGRRLQEPELLVVTDRACGEADLRADLLDAQESLAWFGGNECHALSLANLAVYVKVRVGGTVTPLGRRRCRVRSMQIAPGIHRLGDGTVNAYLLEEAGSVTVIDAAMPGYWNDLPSELAAMGRSLDDIRAVVLTHGHTDHIGFAERLRSDRRVPVSVHELDRPLALGTARNPAGLGKARIGPLLSFLLLGLGKGGLRPTFLKVVSTFGDGATLDVPGAPRVVLVPGHSPGSAALHVATRDALFIGDAIATYSVTTGQRGPQIAPFTQDAAEAVRSLDRLADVDAGLVLPGHGEPWRGGVPEALRLARAAAQPTPAAS